ncbi:putative XRE family transcriptional regulator [Magnetofaba australis IT-1]|uniref:Putative XRE family transcriptional regulator n=1 Tax=Magnetofaba australis IT-1 TaxID=1434232 RepID=A0A1Y2K362_9PROT|nr:putative XRE family transcriptional regulator [Magnetofaba australis IT-1]
MADLANIPRATLATVEKDDANPSLAVVYKIAKALGVSIDELVVTDHERIQLVDSEQMRWTESQDGLYRALTISPPNDHRFSQQIFTLQPGARYEGRPHPPGSEEYLHILKGEVVLEISGEAKVLEEGDSARFKGNVRHNYVNASSSLAQGIVSILEKCKK